MKLIANHARRNVIAYLALFVALGGTSYAAFSVPRNSVGAPQIRNHSITQVKLNPKSIAATVRAWVALEWRGGRLAAVRSSSRVIVSNNSVAETIRWPHRHFPRSCLALATATPNFGGGKDVDGTLTAAFAPDVTKGALLLLKGHTPDGTPSAQAADVTIVCPT